MPSGVPKIAKIYVQNTKDKTHKSPKIEGYFAAPGKSNGVQLKVKSKFKG